jgi:hypothetical protein
LREVPFGSAPLLLLGTKLLKKATEHSNPLSPPVLGRAEIVPRLLRQPEFQAEDDDLAQELARGLEPRLVVCLGTDKPDAHETASRRSARKPS